ncbi:MAG TPA: hypothetical protein VE825_09495 [Terriglobales bacterium]|jgi:hypothetical protein|nr:hypothetical protein [Terriglobales bacterium]
MKRTAILLVTTAILVLPSTLYAQTSPGKPAAGNPPARTPVTADDLRIVERAAELLDSPAKWNRVDPDECPAAAKTFSLPCALEQASQEVSGKLNDRSAVMQEARITADLLAPKTYGGRLSGYNDDPATTFKDIREFFHILRNRLARRMAEEAPGAASASRGEGSSQSRPPVTEADVRIVRRAREILDSPAKWNRADTRVCPKEATTFSLYCALEKATQEVSGNFTHRGAAMQESRFVIDDIAPDAPYYDHRLMDFNNDPGTTFFDVQKFFQLLEDRVAQRLAEEKSH